VVTGALINSESFLSSEDAPADIAPPPASKTGFLDLIMVWAALLI